MKLRKISTAIKKQKFIYKTNIVLFIMNKCNYNTRFMYFQKKLKYPSYDHLNVSIVYVLLA